LQKRKLALSPKIEIFNIMASAMEDVNLDDETAVLCDFSPKNSVQHMIMRLHRLCLQSQHQISAQQAQISDQQAQINDQRVKDDERRNESMQIFSCILRIQCRRRDTDARIDMLADETKKDIDQLMVNVKTNMLSSMKDLSQALSLRLQETTSSLESKQKKLEKTLSKHIASQLEMISIQTNVADKQLSRRLDEHVRTTDQFISSLQIRSDLHSKSIEVIDDHLLSQRFELQLLKRQSEKLDSQLHLLRELAKQN
jgi:hypothetical protein